jgi:hypothetical protein
VSAIEAVTRLVIEGNKTKAARRESLQRGVTKLDEFIGKGQNDAFVKLADLNTTYGRALAAGNVKPVDKLKYVVDILNLQKEVNKSIIATNNLRLDRIIAQAEASTGFGIGDPTANAEAWRLFIQDAAASPYNPTLVGDFDKLKKLTNASPSSFPIEGMDEVIQQYNDRKEAATELNNNAKYLESQFGADAFTNLSSMVGSGNITSDVQTSLGSIPDSVFDNLREVSKKLPGLGDLTTRRDAYDAEIAKINTELSGDLVMQAQTALKSFGLTGAGTESTGVNMKARIMGLPKFQDWAKSNGLKIGSARPATMPGDKQLAGYDSATDTVYVPGPDDERAFRIYHRQISLRPERQILPRRGLEARRVLSVQVGEPSPDAVKVNKDGKYRMLDGQYVTDAEIEAARDKKTTAEVSAATGGKVFKMKDGSFAFISDSPDSDLEPISAEDPRVKAAKFSPAVVAPDNETLGVTEAERPMPSATRTITGRETALLPSDPEGATVLETADGRRIVIPKEQTVDVSEVAKAAPLDGETTRRGIRMPFAALRARRAGVGKTPTEAEVEALPEAGAPSLRMPEAGLPKRGTPTRQEMLEQNIVPMPAPALVATKPEAPATPTPGQEVGEEVRAAMGAPTGATAPKPVGVANGGSKASVPVMDGESMKQKLNLEERIRQMRAARMQSDKDVVAKAGIMPGKVPESGTMDTLKASGKLMPLPVVGAPKPELRTLPITRGQPVGQEVLLDQPSMLTPGSVEAAKAQVMSASVLEGEEQRRESEKTDEQRAEERRQLEEEMKAFYGSSTKPSTSSTARQSAVDEARRKRIAQAAARKRAEDAARAGDEVPPPTMAPYVP